MNILQLSDISVVKLIDENDSYHIKGFINREIPSNCPNCFHTNVLVRNGTTQTVFRDLPMHGKPVAIYLSIQRYKCNHC